MSKKDEALKLAEDALKRVRTQDMELVQLSMIALAAIREALAEQPAQGCEFCSHALYAGTKCKNCGREQPAIKQDLTPEQPAQQQPYGYFKAEPFGWTDCAETDEGAIALYEHPQPAQQEPMTTQTEADRLANQLDYHREYDLGVTHTGIDEQAAAELRRQQAEIERLNEALATQPAQQEHFDHKAAANAALRDAQNRSYQVAKSTQPAQQEPVAWLHPANAKCVTTDPTAYARGLPLYTSPPPQRKPLTDEEIETMANDFEEGYVFLYRSFARAIEAKLWEKNQ